MRTKFFIKTFIIFIIPMLVSTLILGVISITRAVQSYDNERRDQINTQLLVLQGTIDANLREINVLNAILDLNLNENRATLSIFRDARVHSPEAQRNLSALRTNLNALTYTKRFIHSIYVYYNNPLGYFMASGDGLVNLGYFHDSLWYGKYTKNATEPLRRLYENRDIRRFYFAPTEKLFTVYIMQNAGSYTDIPDGVIILNLRRDYFLNLLYDTRNFPQQQVHVFDSHGRLAFSTLYGADSFMNYEAFIEEVGESYVFADRLSPNSGWRYVSVIPTNQFRRIPNFILIQIILYSLLLIVFGFAFAFYNTSQNYHNINSIIEVLSTAERGDPLPDTPPVSKNVYEHITQNILKMFIEGNYLKIQLSERKYRMRTIQLIALQSQINPHFLYNTLSTIYWKSIRLNKGPSDLSVMVQNLSEILKYSLSDPDQTVLLSEELRIAKCYCDIQLARFENLSIEWEYNEDEVNIKVIKMLIQPLIENSIQHGLDGKNAGRIRIRIRVRGTKLNILVADNGQGIEKSRLAEIRKSLQEHDVSHEHIGLVNVAKRLQLKYNSSARLHILSKSDYGTIVGIRLLVFT